MRVEVRLFGGLEKFVKDVRFGEGFPVDLPEGGRVAELLDRLGIPPSQVFSVLINGRHASLADVLREGDRVALFPPLGGG
ncbi:MoaD/ThiS family protein [Ammonifex thiophilus]|uniref:MoaD/ThiS family protein n=1 Tax=Ammonifex thiophilus TaxID=444093 RepID=A0A3D8P3V5_9THEO|nr:MoaD/ThiS family protein [Ammonifex thiophilus]RDV83569.1 MoaD/ThiS family protein [Ammonifex thiophilus]